MDWNEYTREFDIKIGQVTVHFCNESTISFHDPKTGEQLLNIDPTELKLIYDAYRGMEKEYKENEQNRQRQ